MLLAALLTLLGLVAGCDREVEIAPPQPSRDSSGERADGAQQALDRLVRALRDGSRSEAAEVAAAPARNLLGEVADNARALGVDELSLRYVDEGAPLSAEEREEAGPGAWRGSVKLTYRYARYDRAAARLETEVVFVPSSGSVRIAGLGGPDVRTPLWLTGQLDVVSTGRTLLAVAGRDAGRYAALVPRAVRQVRRTLPDWRGPLLVEVPRSAAQLTETLQAEQGEYDNIAAVTTTADGSLAPGAPVRVFLNPAVFDGLKPRGAQVVMSHEATHVATGATFATMPTWLLEGFADFVALDDAGVPVEEAAGQILARIRKDGVPDRLPTSADLDPTANDLGATYEEAWLACRFLAEEHGARRLVRFYEAVSDGASAPEAFRSEVGTTQRAFVTQWRADLARLAGAG